VAQLVHLVGANGLDAEVAQVPGDVRAACGHGRDAGPRKGNLGGGSIHERAIGMACLSTRGQKVLDRRRLARERVHSIGVVPEDAEIGRRGGHAGQAVHHRIRVDGSRRVRVLGHAPHPDDGAVARDLLLDGIQIRAIVADVHDDHADPQLLADSKMAIIPGAGAQELDLAFAPGRRPSRHAKQDRAHDSVVHHGQAGGAADDDLLGCHIQVRRHQPARLRQAFQPAVVAAVDAGGADVVLLGVLEHRERQIQLLRRGLAARHVQLDATGPKRVVTRLEAITLGTEGRGIKGMPIGHDGGPLHGRHGCKTISTSTDAALRGGHSGGA